ncbi:MAG: rcc01693 family protein [Sulfitobacter sp.]
MSKGFDWPVLIRAGLHGLGLAPDVFWSLTPAELQVMLGSSADKAPMLSDGLAALMAAYPDKKKDHCDDR